MSDCAACGKPAQGNAAIHRDGFDRGPEVDLCDECGTHELPTCEQLWWMIAERRRSAAGITSLEQARKRRDEKP